VGYTSESASERILKIGQHLGKLWEKFGVLFFLTHSVSPMVIVLEESVQRLQNACQ